ncbi:hypothetical protein AX14_006319 [Amanita brunnescens Koide BX004]|nr:hypothetical protein AX14_006319 [Amanita brunnescens Koide BX004]
MTLTNDCLDHAPCYIATGFGSEIQQGTIVTSSPIQLDQSDYALTAGSGGNVILEAQRGRSCRKSSFSGTLAIVCIVQARRGELRSSCGADSDVDIPQQKSMQYSLINYWQVDN